MLNTFFFMLNTEDGLHTLLGRPYYEVLTSFLKAMTRASSADRSNIEGFSTLLQSFN